MVVKVKRRVLFIDITRKECFSPSTQSRLLLVFVFYAKKSACIYILYAKSLKAKYFKTSSCSVDVTFVDQMYGIGRRSNIVIITYAA